MSKNNTSGKEEIKNLLGNKITIPAPIKKPDTERKEEAEQVSSNNTRTGAGRPRNAEPSEIITFRIPTNEYNKLMTISQKENVILAELVRQSITRAIENYEKENGEVEPMEIKKKNKRLVF